MSQEKSGAEAELEELRRRVSELEVLDREHIEREDALQLCVLFQRLITSISSDFIDVSPDETEDAIQRTLKTVGEFTQADRSYVFLFRQDNKVMDNTYEWCADGIESRINRRKKIPLKDAIPGRENEVNDLDVLFFSRDPALSDESNSETRFFQEQDAQSLVLAPMTSAGTTAGFLGLDSVSAARKWDHDTISLLKIVGAVLANALTRKMYWQALENERNLLGTLMDNIPDAIYFKDRQSRFARISKAQAKKFGLDSPDQAIGKTDFDIFTEEHARQAFDDEKQIIETGVPVVAQVEKETWADRPETWVSTTKMPLRNSDGEIIGTFGISRNITKLKQMEKALEKHTAAIEQANADLEERNQQLDEFTYAASHDLQEPLRKLIAFSDILREDMQEGNEDDIERDLNVLTSASRRMQSLIQGLLAFSRSGRQDMDIEHVPLDDVIDIALEALEIRVEETKGRIVRETMPRIHGDKMLLALVYQNLIGNALKFHGETPPQIELTAENKEDHWLLGVRDNGIGMKPQYGEQIFSPFKRLHGRDKYEGTGIGLAICRKIVERHGGRIWVESELGKGAYFRFSIDQPRTGETE